MNLIYVWKIYSKVKKRKDATVIPDHNVLWSHFWSKSIE